MATYVLVHGGGHGGWCWQRVAPLLRREGHEVYTPTLTGLGERVHLIGLNPDLAMHITDVVQVLRYEDLTDVILVGHSYGGMVITGVADRALPRIAQLVYLDAAIPADGEAMITGVEAFAELARKEGRTVDGVELVLWPGSEAAKVYGVTDPGDLDWMHGKLTPHPWRTFAQPLSLQNKEAVARIPRTIINCPSTLKMRAPNRLERYRTADRVWEIDTGHDVMITEPRALADMLLTLAAL